MERTLQDLKQWNPLIHQTFWERNPKNTQEIRTYYMSYNPFADRIIPQISNWVVMEPLPEWKPYSQKVMSTIMTRQVSKPNFF